MREYYKHPTLGWGWHDTHTHPRVMGVSNPLAYQPGEYVGRVMSVDPGYVTGVAYQTLRGELLAAVR